MTFKFKLVTRIHSFCEALLGDEHKLTFYFFSARENMLEAHGLDDYELLEMLNYPNSIRE
jgi:hypothetical protein